MLSSSFRRSVLSSRNIFAARSFASGPAAGGEISDEMLKKLGSLSTQALVVRVNVGFSFVSLK